MPENRRDVIMPEQLPVVNLNKTGKNINELRKNAGLTVADLQEHIGLSTNAYYRWFRGEVLPTPENLVHLAYLLQITVDQLLVVEYIEIHHAPVEPIK